MKKKTILSVNNELELNSFKNKSIYLTLAESNNNHGITFLLKSDKNKDHIIFHLNENEKKDLNYLIQITPSTRIKLISNIENNKDDSIILSFDIIEYEVNNIPNSKEIENDSVEDEEFDEDDENDEIEDVEEDISLVEESDLEQIANDLWNECEEEFAGDGKFLNKKRKT